MSLGELTNTVNSCVAVVFMVLYAYQLFYMIVPLLIKSRPHGEENLHRYAVLISARNEAAVIGQLLESINSQTYPREYVTAFVVADNCTDDTARIAAEHGAVIYERFNKTLVGKGYALDYLTERIAEDYGEDFFDGFFVFDADNLLDRNYITEMNRTFSDGYSITTSYRNSKNYGDNWISAGYALWFLREAMYLNRPRMLLGTSCAVSGTGFLFSREILKKCGGWKFFLLTEDIEFTVFNIIGGEKIGFCEKAVLYDEQPVTFAHSWRQRLRWARGFLQVFGKYGAKLLNGIFSFKGFSFYDMTMTIIPAFILMVFSTVFNIAVSVYGALVSGDPLIVVSSLWHVITGGYLIMFVFGAVTTVTEWKQIHTSAVKKIFYLFTFPVFMFTYMPISLQALFTKVEWKPIEHKVSISIDEIGKRH